MSSQRVQPVLIAVTGDGPGLGKSTLARQLHEVLAMDRSAELFREEDILTDCSFEALMAEFRATGEVRTATLVDGAQRFVASVLERGPSVVVLDSLFPYLPS